MSQSTDDGHPEVECPLCGAEVASCGLATHKNSRPCRARQGRQERDERGLKKVSVPTHKEIITDELGGEITTLATDYDSGNHGHAGQLRSYEFAPEELVEEAERRYVPSPRDRADAEYRVVAESPTAWAVKVVMENIPKWKYNNNDHEEGDIHIITKTDDVDDRTRLRKLYRHGDDVYRTNGVRVATDPTPIHAADIDNTLANEALGELV